MLKTRLRALFGEKRESKARIGTARPKRAENSPRPNGSQKRSGENRGRTGENRGEPGRTGEEPGRTGENRGRTGENRGRTGEEPGKNRGEPGRTGEDPVTAWAPTGCKQPVSSPVRPEMRCNKKISTQLQKKLKNACATESSARSGVLCANSQLRSGNTFLMMCQRQPARARPHGRDTPRNESPEAHAVAFPDKIEAGGARKHLQLHSGFPHGAHSFLVGETSVLHSQNEI